MLGGRLSALSLAASASLPARLPATTAPPSKAPPSRRNRRRDVRPRSLSTSVGTVIAYPSFEHSGDKATQTGHHRNGTPSASKTSTSLYCGELWRPARRWIVIHHGKAPLAEDCCSCVIL